MRISSTSSLRNALYTIFTPGIWAHQSSSFSEKGTKISPPWSYRTFPLELVNELSLRQTPRKRRRNLARAFWFAPIWPRFYLPPESISSWQSFLRKRLRRRQSRLNHLLRGLIPAAFLLPRKLECSSPESHLLLLLLLLLLRMTRKQRIFFSIDFSNAKKNTSRKRKKSREADGDSAARTFLTFSTASSSFTRERRINSIIES